MTDSNLEVNIASYYGATDGSVSRVKMDPLGMVKLSELIPKWRMNPRKHLGTLNGSLTSGSSDRKVFVFKGYGDNGAAYLIYQIGRICHYQFGSPLFIVEHKKKIPRMPQLTHPRFDYPFEFRDITIGEMKKMMKPNDLFICNPAYSNKWFGPNLPMKKLMYLQGMNTYPVLDIFFDHYVSVSHFVQQHVKNVFNTPSSVISPFINQSVFRNKTPWNERSNDILILGYKGYAEPVFQYLHEYYKEKYPSSNIGYRMVKDVTQKELADLLNQHKYYLTLNPSEGFGLPPLEAMACGCAVIGFDSMGGRDYFQHGKNAYIVKYGDFEQLAEYLRKIVLDPNIGEDIAKKAVETASQFSYNRFETEWTKYLSEHIYKT
ncbi:glycosyltransferase family 4 protein [Siminovitchia acidinfaciens]|nr:glycosyltransferase [Siminovitchia acidinfaciens]